MSQLYLLYYLLTAAVSVAFLLDARDNSIDCRILNLGVDGEGEGFVFVAVVVVVGACMRR